MKRPAQHTKPSLSAKATEELRARAEAELREFGAQEEAHPIMSELYRRAKARVQARRKNQKLQAKSAPPAVDPQRLVHELEVHQVELEMQNAELQSARDHMEALLERYTDLYDFAPVGYFTLSSNCTVLQVNLTGTRLVGIERTRLVGQLFGVLVAPELRPALHAFLKQVFADPAKHSRDFLLLNPGQPPRPVSLEARRSPNGNECRVAVMDISERKLAENQVRLSEVRYRRLFEAAHDGVLVLDPATCKITDANPFMTTLLGYPHAQLVGKELFEIGLLQDQSASREMFRKLKQSHEVRYENLPLESRSGRHQEVEVVANLYQENGHAVIQCNIRDITARKQAEEAQRRAAVLSASNAKLEQEIIRRQAVEATLTQSEQHQRQLLEQARLMQEQLRQLSRRALRAQEEERKRISRELHDVIAQMLTGINVQLAALKQDAHRNPKGLDRSITSTQRLVRKSVDVVHQFARELRPAVLDDLGLIPALHSFLKNFNTRTGIRTRLTAYAAVEQLNEAQRTVLYRVAQEALTNVAKHAHASRVEVSIEKLPAATRLEIKDNGKAFRVERGLRAQPGGRLGLLGMRERVEMVGGRFTVESAPGQGTAVRVELPFLKGRHPG